LRELESRYPQQLAVIGVHSGKYHAERVTKRIRDASIRLGAQHPVVNDRQFRIWRGFAVSAWPTVVAVDQRGYVVGAHAGEFTAAMLVPFIERLLTSAPSPEATETEPHFPVDVPVIAPTALRYPGKVAVDGKRIAISDSGNHRVLVGTLDASGLRMDVARTIGGRSDFEDGFNASFNSPQGVTFSGNRLYVADAGNHAVRSVDLDTGEVSTVPGNGRQLRTHEDRESGSLSTPWDLVVAGETLYIAMAGIHQLWAMSKGSVRPRIHAGAGGEDIRDGPLEEALLAQPMGIASVGNRLYFADSESSAIRWADSEAAGKVGTLVGTGLFDFGDVDGPGDQVRLQHPQDVAPHPNGRLLIADSYNDCLKWIDPEIRTATKWVGGLSEPGGVACGERHAYVADTNAHRIAVIPYDSAEVAELTME